VTDNGRALQPTGRHRLRVGSPDDAGEREFDVVEQRQRARRAGPAEPDHGDLQVFRGRRHPGGLVGIRAEGLRASWSASVIRRRAVQRVAASTAAASACRPAETSTR
jgi:hypothetical protein